MTDIKIEIVSMPREEFDRMVAQIESLRIQLVKAEEILKTLRKRHRIAVNALKDAHLMSASNPRLYSITHPALKEIGAMK